MDRSPLLFLLWFHLLVPGLKAAKLYVGPTETYTTIGAAMWDVREGDTIIVRDGIYGKNVNVRSSLTLMAEHPHMALFGDGAGPEGVLRINKGTVVVDGFTFNPNGEFPGIVIGGADQDSMPVNCIIRNNQINNRKVGILVMEFAQDITLAGNNIVDCSDNGIVINGKGVQNVVRNRVELNQGNGIVVSPSFNGSATIEKNELSRNGAYGVEIMQSGVTLLGNRIRENMECGIAVRNGLDNIFIGDSNRVDSNEMHGILIEANSQVSLLDNQILSNKDRGIQIDLQGSATVSGNLIRLNGSYGILNEGSLTVTGNTISGNKINGIENRSGSDLAWIENNQILDNLENGVFLMARADLLGNTIAGNGKMGIFLEGPPGTVNITSNNRIQSNVQHGIYISAGGTAVISSNTIEGNGTAVTDMEDYSGILIDGSATVEKNIIRDNHGTGIRTWGNSSNTVIRNNPSINGNREGIVMMGPARIENNTIDSNQLQGIWMGPVNEVEVYKNNLSGNRTGIFIHQDAMNIAFTGCILRGNERGISSRGGSVVRRCIVEDNTETGIAILDPGIDLGQASEEEAGGNTLRNNGNWNIRNITPDTIQACLNFWDTTDTLAIDSAIQDDDEDPLAGPVIFTPFIVQDVTGIQQVVIPSPAKGGDFLEIYPNPIQDAANVVLTLDRAALVSVKVADVRGRVIATLIDPHFLGEGSHALKWNGRTRTGVKLQDGIYIVTASAGNRICSKTVRILR